jgi:hypothetical protein
MPLKDEMLVRWDINHVIICFLSNITLVGFHSKIFDCSPLAVAKSLIVCVISEMSRYMN